MIFPWLMNLRFMRIESILSDLFLTLSQCFSKVSQNFNAETFNVFLKIEITPRKMVFYAK